MSTGSKLDTIKDLAETDELTLQRVLAQLIFDTFVKAIVREHYGFFNPSHAALHVDAERAELFVVENSRGFMRRDDLLFEWSWQFIVGEILDLSPTEVDTFYISGNIEDGTPFLHISGSTLLIASGSPGRKGGYLL
nr:hypothetical protein [Anaerolineae bacterium]